MGTTSKRDADKSGQQKTEDDALNEQLEDSFPASDPPAMTQPHSSTGAPQGKKSVDTTEAERAKTRDAKR